MNHIVRIALVSVAAGLLLPACKRPSDLPDMGVSRTAVAFEAPGGGGEPAPQMVYVVNTGRGALAAPSAEIAYQQGSGWLAATVGDGGAPYGVELRVTSAGLESGVYRATVTLSCGNASASPAQVAVTLTVPDPRFTLSTPTLSLAAPRGGGDPGVQTFEVLNAGRGTLPFPHVDVEYAGTAGWLAVSTTGTSDRYTVTVSAKVAGLDSGVHEAGLTVSAPGTILPRSLRVLLTVPPAELATATTDVRLDGPSDGSDPPTAAVAVMNAGGGLLATPTAAVSHPAGFTGPQWLSAAVSGTPTGYLVTLRAWQVRPGARLDSGPNVATVTITSPDAANPPQKVTVTLEVPPPVVSLSSGSVTFLSDTSCPLPPPAWPIRVSNLGAGNMARPVVTIPEQLATWLEATVVGDRQPYAIRFAMNGLPAHDASGEVTVEVPGVAGSFPIQVVSAIWSFPGEATVAHPPTLRIHAQAGAGDPGPRRVQIASHSGDCGPHVSVSAHYAPGTSPWMMTSAVVPASHRSVSGRFEGALDLVLSASVSGMAAGEVRSVDMIVMPEGASSTVMPVTLELGAPRSGPAFIPRERHTVTAVRSGGALAVGGLNGTPLDWVQRWDGSSASWTGWESARRLAHARYDHGAVAIGFFGTDLVLVCGGTSAVGPELTCEWVADDYFEPSHAGTLVRPRRSPSLVPLADGTVVVASPDESPEILDWATGVSTVVEGVPGWTAVKVTEELVLLTAGQAATLYEPARGTWTPTGMLRRHRVDPALVVLGDGRVLAVGGDPGGASAEIWDPSTGGWTLTEAPSGLHRRTGTITLSNGKVLSTAGYDLELFDPATERWHSAGSLPAFGGRPGIVPARLASGLVVLAGGRDGTHASWEVFTW